MFANLAITPNLKPEQPFVLLPTRRTPSMAQVTSEMICEYVRKHIHERNISKLSREIGITQPHLYRILKKNANPEIEMGTANKFALYLGMSTAEFMADIEKEISGN